MSRPQLPIPQATALWTNEAMVDDTATYTSDEIVNLQGYSGIIFRALGLQNTLSGLVLAYCSFTLPFSVWIMKAYFETVPGDLDKSALVDGCNRLQAYYKVVLPVSGPGLVAGGAFTFMLCWNEFVVAQVLNTKPGTTTLPPVIAGMNGQINIDYSVIAASGFLGALPAVLLVLFFQKYMVQGLTAGSVKG